MVRGISVLSQKCYTPSCAKVGNFIQCITVPNYPTAYTTTMVSYQAVCLQHAEETVKTCVYITTYPSNIINSTNSFWTFEGSAISCRVQNPNPNKYSPVKMLSIHHKC